MSRPSPLRLILLALVSLSACPKRGFVFGPEGRIDDPRRLLEEVARREERIRSMRAEPRASIQSPERSGTLKQLLAVRAPASLHLVALDFFGRPVASMATDGAKLAFFDASANEFYTGSATAEHIALLVPFPISPKELVGALLGAIPRIDAAAATLELDAGLRAYRLTLESDGVTQTVWFGTEDLRPIASRRRGLPGFDLDFDDFQMIDGLLFPMTTKLGAVDAAGRRTGLSVTVTHGETITLNPRLDDAVFRLSQPPRSTLIELP